MALVARRAGREHEQRRKALRLTDDFVSQRRAAREHGHHPHRRASARRVVDADAAAKTDGALVAQARRDLSTLKTHAYVFSFEECIF